MVSSRGMQCRFERDKATGQKDSVAQEDERLVATSVRRSKARGSRKPTSTGRAALQKQGASRLKLDLFQSV